MQSSVISACFSSLLLSWAAGEVKEVWRRRADYLPVPLHQLARSWYSWPPTASPLFCPQVSCSQPWWCWPHHSSLQVRVNLEKENFYCQCKYMIWRCMEGLETLVCVYGHCRSRKYNTVWPDKQRKVNSDRWFKSINEWKETCLIH